MSCDGLFITGTDTGVGKTLVAAALVQLAAAGGRRVAGLKPVASGAVRTADGLRNDDALALQAASSVALPYETVNPCCFEPAIAPHLAAAEAGVPIEVPRLLDGYRTAARQADLAVVEGAGGWRVPLHPAGFLSDLPEQLGLGVILVVGLRLGCLNHARLTFEAIERTGRCRFAGWIGNAVDPDFTHLRETVATLARLLGGSALAVVPALTEATPAAAAGFLDQPAVRSILGLGPLPRLE